MSRYRALPLLFAFVSCGGHTPHLGVPTASQATNLECQSPGPSDLRRSSTPALLAACIGAAESAECTITLSTGVATGQCERGVCVLAPSCEESCGAWIGSRLRYIADDWSKRFVMGEYWTKEGFGDHCLERGVDSVCQEYTMDRLRDEIQEHASSLRICLAQCLLRVAGAEVLQVDEVPGCDDASQCPQVDPQCAIPICHGGGCSVRVNSFSGNACTTSNLGAGTCSAGQCVSLDAWTQYCAARAAVVANTGTPGPGRPLIFGCYLRRECLLDERKANNNSGWLHEHAGYLESCLRGDPDANEFRPPPMADPPPFPKRGDP
ncbi:MAG: hypothetical protein RJA70_1093 [Pseudomonadota bacterium]|jgi:hypothetical protein